MTSFLREEAKFKAQENQESMIARPNNQKNDTCPRSNKPSHHELNAVGNESQKAQVTQKWDLAYSFIH